MYALSIVVPFYNSGRKCGDILNTLGAIRDQSVEIILVDDGSTDDTLVLLTEFSRAHPQRPRVITQDNRGPGGARNAGFKAARGTYVWGVDSDDDIRPEAIEAFKPYASQGVDFVDFNYAIDGRVINGMEIPEGLYGDPPKARATALSKFGWLLPKIIRRDWILQNGLLYPEHCYYEDNAMHFLYPLAVASFVKSNEVAYLYRTVAGSVSREGLTPRFFDRMYSAAYGLRRGLEQASGAAERDTLIGRFVLLYLYNTVGQLISSNSLSDWIVAARVMRHYRTVTRLHLGSAPWPWRGKFEWAMRMGRRTRVPAVVLYCASYFLPDQTAYFERIRMIAWGRAFVEPSA